MGIPKDVSEMELYAWVGEDEMGSGEVGLKQALVPAGMIPLVAIQRKKVLTGDLLEQHAEMVKKYGKPRFLCKFKFEEIEMIIDGECN